MSRQSSEHCLLTVVMSTNSPEICLMLQAPFFQSHISAILCVMSQGAQTGASPHAVGADLQFASFLFRPALVSFSFRLQAVNRGLTGSRRSVALVC